MSRWEERPSLPNALDDHHGDGDLEEIPTVLMTQSGSEPLFDDLRERYRRVMEGHELTSPPQTAPDPHDDSGAFELVEASSEIDPLDDYLEMHALASGAYPVVDAPSDPMGMSDAGWGQPLGASPATASTPPPAAFSSHGGHGSGPLHGTPPSLRPAPAPSLPSAPRHTPPGSLRPPTNPEHLPGGRPWGNLPADPSASIPQSWSRPGAPPAPYPPHGQPQTAAHGPMGAPRQSPPPPPVRNQRIPVGSAVGKAYGRTIPPTSTGSFARPMPTHTNPTFPPPRARDTYRPESAVRPNPHRWDAWILAGFAIAGIWALALVRLFA